MQEPASPVVLLLIEKHFLEAEKLLGNEATNEKEQVTCDKVYYIHRNRNVRKRYIITKEKRAAFRQ